ncbi:MAG TPA: hypothetical protein PKZ16_00560 [bacterium]|nr:hypothetical protein [bacterium]HPL95725.1 hypothetical protein [bacterium]
MHPISKFVYWTPRILSILFILFLSLFSLDVFDMDLNFWQTIVAFLIHNIPVFILLIILTISWRCEIIGGVTFIIAGLLYLVPILITMIKNGFEWYYIAWITQISGVAFFIGIMFLICWYKRKN